MVEAVTVFDVIVAKCFYCYRMLLIPYKTITVLLAIEKMGL